MDCKKIGEFNIVPIYRMKECAFMLKSMTGFGRFETANEKHKITVEMKSVNHRYLDMSIKMPKKLSIFEAGIRNVLKRYIGRGKVDVFIAYEDYAESNVCVKYNEKIAKEYYNYLRQISEDFQVDNDIHVSTIARLPEVFTLEEQSGDDSELWTMIEEAVIKAAERFVESRIIEGKHLKEDLIQKLNGMIVKIDTIEERGPEILTAYRQKLMDKVYELLSDNKIDEVILATELTIFADKICVDEETVRLKSHIQNMKLVFEEGDTIGRKLDFIAQEMNREANTILSKANDMLISNLAIDLKTEIEKIREQIQNIE